MAQNQQYLNKINEMKNALKSIAGIKNYEDKFYNVKFEIEDETKIEEINEQIKAALASIIKGDLEVVRAKDGRLMIALLWKSSEYVGTSSCGYDASSDHGFFYSKIEGKKVMIWNIVDKDLLYSA